MSEQDSRRQRIVDDFLTKLGGIEVGNEFRTDAGKALFAGWIPELGTDKGDPELAIALIVGEDTVTWSGMKSLITLPIEIHALAKAQSRTESWLEVEALVADVKQAIEVEDELLGGLLTWRLMRGATRTRPRESGSLMVGAQLDYEVRYAESWGAPEA